MQKIFNTTHRVIGIDKIHVTSTNIKTNKKLEETVIISDPKILHGMDSLIGAPLEEYAYGDWGESANLKDIITSVEKQVKSQLS